MPDATLQNALEILTRHQLRLHVTAVTYRRKELQRALRIVGARYLTLHVEQHTADDGILLLVYLGFQDDYDFRWAYRRLPGHVYKRQSYGIEKPQPILTIESCQKVLAYGRQIENPFINTQLDDPWGMVIWSDEEPRDARLCIDGIVDDLVKYEDTFDPPQGEKSAFRKSKRRAKGRGGLTKLDDWQRIDRYESDDPERMVYRLFKKQCLLELSSHIFSYAEQQVDLYMVYIQCHHRKAAEEALRKGNGFAYLTEEGPRVLTVAFAEGDYAPPMTAGELFATRADRYDSEDSTYEDGGPSFEPSLRFSKRSAGGIPTHSPPSPSSRVSAPNLDHYFWKSHD